MVPAPLHFDVHALPGARDPHALFEQTMREWNGIDDVWVFGYASLIWRPEFEHMEQRRAAVYGWHRALEMRSRVNRGTPECPGLVFALVRGGCCHGIVYRIAADSAREQLERLWAREMPNGIYDPRWLQARTPAGRVKALAFTLSHKSPSHTGPVPDHQMIDILKRANGRYGTTLAYLVETAHCLKVCGIRDRDVERLVALARRHALTS